ncbi:MAG: GGDEF domain-containing response regulator [Glaciecola sp.]
MDIVTSKPQIVLNKPEAPLYRVLIVDDSNIELENMMNGLSDNFSVSIASDANEALRIAHQSPQPDLILLDIVMPEIDGYSLCSTLKNDYDTQNIPIIFVTSSNDTSSIIRGFEVGGVDYMTKPLKLPELNIRIQTHIQLKNKSKQLESLAYLDPLTRTANRRKYNETFQYEWSRCIRYKQPIAIIIVDIDFFKQFNEHYGHAEGDNCLTQVAQLLNGQCKRSTDLFARIGGEEFIMLMPNCDLTDAVTKAEEMQTGINQAKIRHDGIGHGHFLTVSLGVAATVPQYEHEAISLFQKADDALFNAKGNGRNRITVDRSGVISDSSMHSLAQH